MDFWCYILVGDKMSKKVDIRLLLYQVFNMHKLVLDCIKKNLYDDAYLLLSLEFKKYEYIRDNLKKKIKISSYYLEYSTTIDTKINDIKYALNFVNKKIHNIPNKISKNTLIKLYKLQLNNLIYYFNIIPKIPYKDKRIIYYVFIYLCKKIKNLDKSFYLNNLEKLFFARISPFKAQ